MNRNRRTKILIEGTPALPAVLGEQIEKQYQVHVVEAPNPGLVMVKARENAKRSLFYLGEVFVTEAKVEINGHIGLGIVQGTKPELARQLAIIDAAYKGQLKETQGWEPLLLQEEAQIERERLEKEAALLATKVQFDTMSV